MKVRTQQKMGVIMLALALSATLAGAAQADQADNRTGKLGTRAESTSTADVLTRAVARGLYRHGLPDDVRRTLATPPQTGGASDVLARAVARGLYRD